MFAHMNDGSATTPESGGQQQPQHPAAPPSQGAAPGSPFPPHAEPQQAAYGYPPPQEPGQPGYGYPQGFGGYGYPPAAAAEPDWQQLADRNAQAQQRRKRAFLIGGGVLAAAALAGIVGTTLVLSDDARTPAAADTPAPSVSSSASASTASPLPTPTTPLALLSDARLDRAPVSVGVLFAAPTLTIQGRVYTLLEKELDKGCKLAPVNGLEQTLASLDCYNVYRATYAGPDHVQITVGVATFASASRATKAKSGGKGNMSALVKGPVKDFCRTGVTCATTRSSLGRYAYFTLAGPDDGSAVASNDKTAQQAARDISGSVYETLLERGRTGLAAAG
ncbi:hypothetical protein GCM10025734_37500 [Kitasatospora paranensis]